MGPGAPGFRSCCVQHRPPLPRACILCRVSHVSSHKEHLLVWTAVGIQGLPRGPPVRFPGTACRAGIGQWLCSPCPMGRSRVWAWPCRPQLCGYMYKVRGQRPFKFSVSVQDGSFGWAGGRTAVRWQRRRRGPLASNLDVCPLHHLTWTHDGPHSASVCEESLAWPFGQRRLSVGPGRQGAAPASSAVSRGPENWGSQARWRPRASSPGAPCSSRGPC